MLDHADVQLKLRALLATMVAATTGLTSLTATSTGYTRQTGSFLADGFAVGMEVTPTNMATTTPSTLLSVSALSMTANKAITAQASGASRMLEARLPSDVQYGNLRSAHINGQPYFEEEYDYGPTVMPVTGPFGTLIAEPIYILRVFVVSGVDVIAHSRYANALLSLFPPTKTLALASGDTLRVRSDPAPFANGINIREDVPSWSVLPITIPLRAYTRNLI